MAIDRPCLPAWVVALRAGGSTRGAARCHAALVALLVCALVTLLLSAAASAAPGPALSVDAQADRRAIPEEIYGMSFAEPDLAAELDLPVNRWGGNYADRYNWRLDAWNTGHDWFFENIPGCWGQPACRAAPTPAEQATRWRRIVDGDRAVGAETLLTLPMVGSVAGSVAYSQPLACSYPTTRWSGQDQADPWAPCGNGRVDGAWMDVGADPSGIGLAHDAQLAADWLADLTAHYGRGAVRFYGLGNEPALWSDTHRDVHPAPATSGEILQRSIALAQVVKQADPAGQTLGLSEWGWPHYFASAAETEGRPDPAKPAGEPLATWFLDRMREQERATGTRLLDFLDLHYYQQETALGAPATTEVTRSLWDASYTDPGWISHGGAVQIQLLPRMRRWVADHYPGTKISLSEYDLSIGGSDPTPAERVTDTLIQADVLGIFARERIDLAARWGPPAADDVRANAFRLYRSYDGAGGRFGDTWARSLSADQSRVAVYGATRGADGALTVAIVNKHASEQTSTLTLAGLDAGAGGVAQTWRWTSGAERIVRGADVAMHGANGARRGANGARRGAADAAARTATLTLPARSLTLLVLPGATEPDRDPPGRDPPGGDPPPPGRDLPGGTPPGGTPPGGTPAPRPPTPGGRRPRPLADRIGLPSNARCVRSSALRFRLRSPDGRRLRSAQVKVARRRVARLRGRALGRAVVVRSLPRGRFIIQVRLGLAGERRNLVVERRYRRCR